MQMNPYLIKLCSVVVLACIFLTSVQAKGPDEEEEEKEDLHVVLQYLGSQPAYYAVTYDGDKTEILGLKPKKYTTILAEGLNGKAYKKILVQLNNREFTLSYSCRKKHIRQGIGLDVFELSDYDKRAKKKPCFIKEREAAFPKIGYVTPESESGN